MEEKKPYHQPRQLFQDPYERMHENSFGFFVHFKIGKWNFDNDMIRWIPIVHKKNAPENKKSLIRRMLDSAGLIPREVTILPLNENEQVKVRRDHVAAFSVQLDGFLTAVNAEIGDTLELHFRMINGEFEKVTLRMVNPEERDFDIDFADIVMQMALHQNDPIWEAGAALIEKALRATNPSDPTYYGSKSGSLSFWSYRSYDAREENYIQWRWNTVGELYVEAVSNKYAWPKISVDGINHLLENGWSSPSEDEEDDLPNFFRTYDEVDAKVIADDLMKVFRDVYFIKRDWIWLFQPFRLVEELFGGDTEDDFKFKPEAFFIYDKEQTFERRCEMGVQLSEDVLIPEHLRPLN